MMNEIKTKFNAYISFGIKDFDTTPDAENYSGCIDIPTVCLDGDFTIDELRHVLIKMEAHVKNQTKTNNLGALET